MTAKSPNKKTTLHRFRAVEWIFMNLPFVCYLAILALLYIANAHNVDQKLRKIELLKQEVKDTEWHYLNMQKHVMHGSTPTQMESKVKDQGIKMTDDVPDKLTIKTP